MSIRPIVFMILFVTFAAASARAESVFGLSYFGGDIRFADARAEGRGGVGLAYLDSLNAGVKSPTQLPDIRRLTVTITSTLDTRDATDAIGSLSRTNLIIPTAKVALPLTRRLGLGFGFEAARNTQWSVVRPFADDDTVEESIVREGTAFVVPFELGLRLHPKFSVGGGLLVERGTVRDRYDLRLGGGLIDPEEVREETHRGEAWRIAGAVHDLGPVSATAFFVPEHDADVDVKVRGRALSNREDISRTDTRPARWAVGGKLDLPGRWSVGVDVEREMWSEYKGRRFFDQAGDEVTLQDEETLRLGVERSAVPVLGSDWTTPWRAGFYMRKWNYQLNGNDVNEWGATLGTGIPFRGGRARADLAVTYGRIGSLSDNGVEEDVFRIVVSVSAGEKWY